MTRRIYTGYFPNIPLKQAGEAWFASIMSSDKNTSSQPLDKIPDYYLDQTTSKCMKNPCLLVSQNKEVIISCDRSSVEEFSEKITSLMKGNVFTIFPNRRLKESFDEWERTKKNDASSSSNSSFSKS